MDETLPEAGILAWRLTGWLGGNVPTDTVLEQLSVVAPVQSVRSDPASGLDVEGPGLLPLLTLLRSLETGIVGAVFPEEGDLRGLAGPPAFNAAAVEEAQALVVPYGGIGVTPRRVGQGLTWTIHRARRRQPGDVGEADRQLRAALTRATDDLVQLDVAAWSPQTADSLMDLGRAPEWTVPPGVPSVAVRLAARATRLVTITDLALTETGGALSSTEVNRRADVVRELRRSARHALGDACSMDAWPQL